MQQKKQKDAFTLETLPAPKYPLRRIISSVNEDRYYARVTLSCGHTKEISRAWLRHSAKRVSCFVCHGH